MDYEQHYNRLIKRGRNRLLEGYTEQHHIIPRCVDGTDDPTNLVRLTAEEHYVAHQLLIKIYPDQPKLIFAAKMMTVNSNGGRINNKLYGWLKRKYSNTISGKPLSEEHKAKISKTMSGRKLSDSHIKKISKANKGVPKSADHKAKVAAAQIGRKAWNKGKKIGSHSKKHRQRLAEAGKLAWIKRKANDPA